MATYTTIKCNYNFMSGAWFLSWYSLVFMRLHEFRRWWIAPSQAARRINKILKPITWYFVITGLQWMSTWISGEMLRKTFFFCLRLFFFLFPFLFFNSRFAMVNAAPINSINRVGEWACAIENSYPAMAGLMRGFIVMHILTHVVTRHVSTMRVQKWLR